MQESERCYELDIHSADYLFTYIKRPEPPVTLVKMTTEPKLDYVHTNLHNFSPAVSSSNCL